MIDERPARPEPWYRQFWPWFLIGLPASIVVACMYMLFLALGSPLSMVEDDYYKKGLAINTDLSARDLAGQLGLGATVRLFPEYIQVDMNRDQLSGLELAFVHPTNAARDLHLTLEQLGARRFQMSWKEPLTGRYRLDLQGLAEPGEWVLSKDVQIDFDDSAADSSGQSYSIVLGEQGTSGE